MRDIVPENGQEVQPRSDFYVYRLRRPTQEGLATFYVGKGCKKRILHHEWNANKHGNCKHQICRVIRKVWREGGKIDKEKIAENLTEQEAFELECLQIAQERAEGSPLVNQTNGGEGTSGFKTKRTPEQNEQNRQRTLARLANPEEREKMRQAGIRRFSDPEERRKQSQRTLRHFSDPQVREQHRQQAIERAANAEEISEEEREVRRQRALDMWSDPGQRERHVQKRRERYADPNEIERSRQRTKELWQTPQYRDKLLATRKDPEVRAKQSKARSEATPNKVGTFDGFVDPQGNIHTPVINLAAFCKAHNLSYCGMWLVVQEKQIHHKGWVRYYPPGKAAPIFQPKERKSIKGNTYHAKTYDGLVAPDGITAYTNIHNMKEFCKEHNLSPTKMCSVANGKLTTHKGWTRYKP